MTPTIGEQAELRQQLERAREALRAPPHQKVSLVLGEFHGLIDRLERVTLYQTELNDIRHELIGRVARFQDLVRDVMRKNPDHTFDNARVVKAAREIDYLLSRIAEFVGP